MPTIDERIVQMQFDNKDFEKNVGQSVKSLDTLKQSLNFENSYSGLDKFAKALNKFNLDGIKNSIDDIGKHFTVVGRFIDRHIDGIIHSVESKLTGLLKSISVDQISQGFGKYETQTKAVQTITNATGKSVAEVEEVLDKLMKYTDETSYDFVTMAESIGKFTSVGIELEKAERAMEGIANEAAVSGAGKAEANRAMYNFAQALSAGKVQLIDWKSIANANMSTKEFKEELIKTALAMGTLTKTGETTGKIITGTGKSAKETAVDYKSFEQTLSSGWLTSNVLIETLERYADTSTKIGEKSFKAAQKALTWGDAIGAIKDAVSSQWMKSFKLIFGNLDEAIDLWTNFCNAIIEVTGAIGDYRNGLLQGWHEQGGYNAMIEAASNIWSTFVNVLHMVRDAFSQIFPPTTSEKLVQITEHIRDVTESWKKMFGYVEEQEVEEEIEKITDGAEDLADSIDKGFDKDKVKALQEELIKAGYKLDKYGADGIYGPETQAAVKKLQADIGVKQTGVWDATTKKATIAAKKFKSISKSTESVFKKLGDIFVTEEEYERTVDYANRITKSLKEGFTGSQVKILQDQLVRLGYLDKAQANGIFGKGTKNALKQLQKALGVEATGVWDKNTQAAVKSKKAFVVVEHGVRKVSKTVGAQTSTMERFQKITTGAAAAMDILSRFAGLCGKVLRHFSSLFKPLGDGFLTIISVVSDCTVSYRDYLVESGKFEEWFEKAKTWLAPFGNLLKTIGDSINAFFARHPDIKTFTQLWDAVFGEFKQLPLVQKYWEKIKPIATNIKDFFKKIKDSITSFFSPKEAEGEAASGNKKTILEQIQERFSAFIDGINKAIGFIKKINIGTIITFAIGILSVIKIIKGIRNLFAPVEFLKSITGTIESVGDYFSAKAKTTKLSEIGKMILRFGVAIALLAASIYFLSSLDPKKAWSAVGMIAALSAIVIAFSVAMNKFNKKGMGKSIKGLIKLSLGMLLLSFAISILGKLSTEQLVKGLLGVTSLLLVIGIFASAMQGKKGVKGLLSLSISMVILSLAMKTIGEMNAVSILKSVAAIGALLIELGIFLTIVNGKQFKNSPLALTDLGECITLITNSLQVLANLSWGGLLKGLVGIGAILLELVAFTKLVGRQGAYGFNGFTAIGEAISNIAASFMDLSTLTWEEIIKALTGLGLIFLEVAIFLKLAASKHPIRLLGTALSMVVIGKALMQFTKVIERLSKINARSLLKAILTLGIVFLEIAAFMKMLGTKKGFSKISNGLALIGIAAAISMFVGTIKEIGEMNSDELIRGIAGLGAVLLEIAVFMRLVKKVRVGLSAIPMLLVMAVALFSFGATLKLVADIPWTTIAAFGIGFGAAMSSIGSAMWMLSLIPVKGALIAIANLDIFIANLLIVLGALGGLQKLTDGGLGDWLASGAQALGQAIGGFIAGITDPFRKEQSATKKKKSFGDYLRDLISDMDGVMEVLEPFLNKVGTITEDKVKGVKGLVSVMAMMSGTEILDAISGFISRDESGSGFVAFAKSLVEVVPLLAQFSRDASSINEKDVEHAATAIEKFSGVASAVIPLSASEILDAVASFLSGKGFNGESAFVAFAEKIVELIPHIVSFSDLASGIKNTNNIETAATAIEKFSSVASAVVPLSVGEILDAIGAFLSGKGYNGGSPFIAFAEKLVEFIPHVSKFSDLSVGLSATNIENAASAIEAFADVGRAVMPLSASEVIDAILSFLSGNNGDSAFVAFANKLVQLMPRLLLFSNLAKAISVDGMNTAASAMGAFGEVCNAAMGVSWSGFIDNILDFINGNNNIISFTDKMLIVAPKLKEFGDVASGIDNTAIQNSATSLSALADVANQIPGANGLVQKIFGEHDIEAFGSKLETLGDGLYKFYDSTKGIPASYETSGYVKALVALASIGEKLPAAGGFIQSIFGEQSLDTFGSSLTTLGDGLYGFYNTTKDIPQDYTANGPLAVLNSLSELQSGLEAQGGKLHEWIFGEKSLEEFGNQISALGADLFSFNASTILVNTEKIRDIASALASIATAAYSSGNGSFMATGMQQLQTAMYQLSTSIDWTPIIDIGETMITNIVSGFDNANPSFPDSIDSLLKTAGQKVTDSNDTFSRKAQALMTAMSKAISGDYKVRNAFNTMLNAVVRVGSDKYDVFRAVGIYLDSGLARGVYEGESRVIEAAKDVMRAAYWAACNEVEVASPSKKFAEIGMYLDLGLVKGLEQYASNVKASAADSAASAIDGAKGTLATFSSLIMDEIDDTPVIRPVLDLSNVAMGAAGLTGMFGTQTIGLQSAMLANRIAYARNEVPSVIYEGKNDNSNLNSTIEALNSRIDQLSQTISNMKVVTETGALIGEILPGIDKGLGKRAAAARRGG